jgi:lycopene cyclase domain-containing protein
MLNINNFEYLIVLLFSVLPTSLIFFFYKEPVHRQYKYPLIKSLIITAIIFIIWDIYATHRGHWSFNPNYITNVFFINLPVEEVLFFICIPFSCIFLWESILHYAKKLS